MVQVAMRVRGTSQDSRTAQWGTMTSSHDVIQSDHKCDVRYAVIRRKP